MGYTPAFDSIYTGTLYGQWPTAAVWASLLPLADARGEINLSPEAIAGMTGWPLDLLSKGICALCLPDPRSRSKDQEGRRLVPIDPLRDWGWRVVNIQLYRERARDQNRVSDGRNAEKLRQWRETRRNPVKPGETRGNRTKLNSDSDSDSYKNKSKRVLRTTRVPSDFVPDLDHARSQLPDVDAEREAQKFRDWEFKTPRSDWVACWRTWIGNCKERGQYAKRSNGGWQ